MDARCQCGAVSFKTPLPQPLALYICHCSDCRRQAGSAFGTSAIFPRFKLPEVDLLSCYARPTPAGHTLYCYFCRNCGTRLLHTTPAKNVVSVKGGCLEGLDWNKAIHLWTKSAMVPIPEGSESYSEEPDSTDYGSDKGDLDQAGELAGSGSCHVTTKMARGEQTAEEKDRISGACELSGKVDVNPYQGVL